MKLNKKTVISLIPKAVLLILLLVIINTQLTESVVTGTFEKGLVFSILALGIFISFRILDIPDLSVDGTFTLGVAVSVMQAFNGDPIKGILLSIVAGAIAGSVTGILITKLNVQPILAGIITMTALYSINLKIMDRPNISLYKKDTIFTMAQKYFGDYYKLAAAGIVLVIAAVLLFWFLKTQAGMSLRATGDNEYMVRASSINSDRMKIMGFAIANALVSLSGAMYAQYSSAGDSNSGTGMLVVGLASIIIGEIFFSKHSILCGILAAIFGAIAYRFVLAFAMNLGMDSNYTIGSNGAGKSTLMNVISGSYEADTGKIFLDGKNITHLKEHQRARTIGRLFQDPLRGTAPNMTIEENLGLAYSRGKRRSLTIGIRKKDVSVFRERLKELDLGLEDRMKMPVGLLSGGQRQALTLLMATIVTPKLLLLDEHTAALDPKTAEKVMRITEKIVKENALTTLMITHNISNAIEYGNKTIVMSQGKLLLTIEGEQRANMTVEKLMKLYSDTAEDELSDKMILQE